jgi:hypothetical protein
MNEMYSMGLSIHSLGTVALLGVILLNVAMLKMAGSLQKYKRLNSIVLLPLTATIIGLAVFTGVVMMAAKHLDFTIPNLAMIAISIVLVVLEVKRAKSLRYMNPQKARALDAYKLFASKILYVEFALALVISAWMWLI